MCYACIGCEMQVVCSFFLLDMPVNVILESEIPCFGRQEVDEIVSACSPSCFVNGVTAVVLFPCPVTMSVESFFVSISKCEREHDLDEREKQRTWFFAAATKQFPFSMQVLRNTYWASQKVANICCFAWLFSRVLVHLRNNNKIK